MTLADLAPVIAATWPPARTSACGPFTIPGGGDGGNRVSAARLTDPQATDAAEVEIDAAIDAMQGAGRMALFMVLDMQTALDDRLARRGLALRDATLGLVAQTATLAAAPPPVTCFSTWPPLAIQAEIWAAGGIGPARLAIMARAAGPKVSLFGRIDDTPAGAAFLGIHDGMAMLHALEVLPAGRRKGLARIMMRAAAEWALANGADRISTLVTRENRPAQGLYASLGFEPVGHYHYRTATA